DPHAPIGADPRGRPPILAQHDNTPGPAPRAQFARRVLDGPAASVPFAVLTVPATGARFAVRVQAILRLLLPVERVQRLDLAAGPAGFRVGGGRGDRGHGVMLPYGRTSRKPP